MCTQTHQCMSQLMRDKKSNIVNVLLACKPWTQVYNSSNRPEHTREEVDSLYLANLGLVYCMHACMCECCCHDANVRSTSKYTHMHTCMHTPRVITSQDSKPVSALVMKAVCCIGQKVTSTTRWSSSHVDNKISIWYPSPILSICCTCGRVWSVTSLAGLRMYNGLIMSRL